MGVHEDTIALEGIIESAPVALVAVTEELEVLLWNAAAEALFGWKADEVVGRPVPTVPPEREKEFRHHVDLLRQGRTLYTETWRRRRDGSLVEVRVTAAPLTGASGRFVGWIVSYADLTEQRLAERALEARSGELEAIFAAFPDLYFWFGPDNRILAQRAGRRSDLYTEPARFVGLRPREYLPEATGRAIEAAADRARRTGGVQAIEYMLPIGGREVYFEARFAALAGDRVISIVRNITEMKRTERDLRDSLELLQGVVENTPDAIFLKDREGRYRMVNAAAARWMGRRPEQVVGRRDADLFPEAVQRQFRTQDQPILDDGVTRRYEERIPTAEGERELLTTKSALRDAKGRVSGLIGVSHDVTDLHRLEAQFRQSQKMEAIGRLAGGVAHDFNNLLTVILSSAELLLRRVAEEDPSRAEVQQIVEAAERAGSLTRQLLAFSRRRILEPKVVDLTRVLDTAEKMLRRLIGEHIRMETQTEPGCQVRADPGQLEQVLINLAVNARDAMPGGGLLWFSTRNVTVAEGVETPSGTRPPGDYVELEVRDTGVGMDAETLSHIYEPFYTTKGPGEGSGLGLTTVYGIVQQLGGTLHAESAPGEGTRFVIRLPRETAPETEEAPEEARGPVRGDETVLVVEDDEQVRELVLRALSYHGYRVVVAGGGEEALRRLEALPRGIDLLLTDVVMPGMNGREVAEAVQERQPDARVVFMTGYSDDTALDRRILERGEPLLHKPFTGAQLARAVRGALDR